MQAGAKSGEWCAIVEAQPSVRAAAAEHLAAAIEATKWEARTKRIYDELTLWYRIQDAADREDWQLVKILTKIGDQKGYWMNHGPEHKIRDERITWRVQYKTVSDLYGPEGEQYHDMLIDDLQKADAKAKAAEAVEAEKLAAYQRERERYAWLRDYTET